MQTFGNLDGGIAEKVKMEKKPLASAITRPSESAYQGITTSTAPSLMCYRMRCFTPTFPTQMKLLLSSLERTWLMLKGNFPIASLPDMGDDDEWDEEEIYK